MAGELDPVLKAALLEDLGDVRLEAMPIDDGPRCGGRDPNYSRTNIRNAVHHPTQANAPLSRMWQTAQANGVFNDEDARAVRNLDPLGGGRSYAEQGQRVTDSILGSMATLSNHGGGAAPQPPSRRSGRGGRQAGRFVPVAQIPPISMSHLGTLNHGQPVRQSAPGYKPAQVPIPLTTSESADASVFGGRPISMGSPAPKPATKSAPKNGIETVKRSFPIPTQLINEPPHKILQQTVKYRSAKKDDVVMAAVLLCAEDRPDLGRFYLYEGNQCIGCWPILALTNHVNKDSDLLVLFKACDVGHTYSFTFRDKFAIEEFLREVDALKEGKYLKLVQRSKPTKTSPKKENVPFTAPAPRTQEAIDSKKSLSGPATTNLPSGLKAARVQTSQEANVRDDQVSSSDSRLLVDFNEAGVDNNVSQKASSEAADLLSTLDPLEWPVNEGETHLTPPGKAAEKELKTPKTMAEVLAEAAQGIMSISFMNDRAGSTKAEMKEFARGVATAITNKWLETQDDFRALADEEKDSMKKEILAEVFGGLNPDASCPAKKNEANPRPSTSMMKPAGSSTLQPQSSATTDGETSSTLENESREYHRHELLSLRGHGKKPPAHLFDPEFTPPTRGRGDIPEATKTMHVNSRNSIEVPAKDSEWLFGGPANDTPGTPTVIKAQVQNKVRTPGTEKKESKTSNPLIDISVPAENVRSTDGSIDSTPGTPQGFEDKGLVASLWSDGVSTTLARVNNFTGPGYEFRTGTNLWLLSRLGSGDTIAKSTDANDVATYFLPAKKTATEIDGKDDNNPKNDKDSKDHKNVKDGKDSKERLLTQITEVGQAMNAPKETQKAPKGLAASRWA